MKKNSSQLVYVHMLVAEAFVPNPNNYKFVKHKDGNKTNNCADTLEWVESLETNLHKSNHCIENKVKKIDPVTNCTLKTYNTIKEASLDNNVGLKQISAVCYKKQEVAGEFKWKFVEDEEIEGEI